MNFFNKEKFNIRSQLLGCCPCRAIKRKGERKKEEEELSYVNKMTLIREEIRRKQSRITSCSEIEYEIEFIRTGEELNAEDYNKNFTFANLFGEMKVCTPRISYCQNYNIEKLLEYRQSMNDVEVIEFNGLVII